MTMAHRFEYVLGKENALDYYRFIYRRLPKFKWTTWWIRLSIPFLAIATVVAFPSTRKWYVLACLIFLSMIWLMYGAPFMIQRVVNAKVDLRFLDKLGITLDQRIVTIIDQDGINVDDSNSKHKVRYSQIVNVVPLSATLVILTSTDLSILIPYSAIGNDDQVRKLVGTLFDSIDK